MMRHRLGLLFVLAILSTPAQAHGVEMIVFTALIYGIGVGIVGGVVNGLVWKERLLPGLLVTIAIYFLAGLALVTFDILSRQSIPDVLPIALLQEALFVASLQALSALPLVIAFLCAHLLTRFARSRLGAK